VNALPAIKKTWTPEEYLAWERRQSEKHELHGKPLAEGLFAERESAVLEGWPNRLFQPKFAHHLTRL
jgi:hypothetical protein